MQFIICHGTCGSPEENWFPALKDKLTLLKQKVIVPQFPVDSWDEITRLGPDGEAKNQSLSNWLNHFQKEVLPQLNPNEKICLIGHSIACVFILHLVQALNLKLDCAIFVSPFLGDISKAWQFRVFNKTFYKTDFNWASLQKQIPVSYVIYSNNDPYVEAEHSISFAKAMNSSAIMVRGAQHFSSSVRMKDLPLVLELCKSRMELTEYQML